jgi:DNA-binding CsgD family transcriptional regulator
MCEENFMHELSKFIKKYSTPYAELATYMLIKDLNSIYAYGNDKLAKLVGYKTKKELEGISDYDLKCDAAQRASEFQKADRGVIKNNLPQRMICVDKYSDNNMHAILAIMQPLVNANKKVIGIATMGIELGKSIRGGLIMPNLFCQLTSYDDKHIKSNNNKKTFTITDQIEKLSKREAQCLFYILRGKMYKEIAGILHVSTRTIESYVESIKIKLDCHNKSEIIDKALVNGYDNYIPENIAYNGCLVLL